jgi:hypothetical protein
MREDAGRAVCCGFGCWGGLEVGNRAEGERDEGDRDESCAKADGQRGLGKISGGERGGAREEWESAGFLMLRRRSAITPSTRPLTRQP